MNKKKIILIAVAVVAVAGISIRLFGGSTAKHKVTYETATVIKGEISESITATGTIEPVTEVEVGTQVSGIIDKIYADYNSVVTKGQLIAEMDRVTLQSEVASQRAAYNGAKAEYEYQRKNYERNRGLHEAQAPLVAFIDDDERVNEGFLRAYLEFFETRPGAVVAGGRIVAEYPAGRPAWMSKYVEMPIANPMDFGERVRPFPAGRVPGGGNMAFRRAGLAGYGEFDPTLGRVNGELIGGEENDFFERLLLGGETIWYVPGAVMWHIIPPAKLTGAYFRRLSYNVGVSQRLRAEIHRRLPKTFVLEIAKWAATLVLCCTMPPRKSRWLLRMRLEISRGLFTKIKN